MMDDELGRLKLIDCTDEDGSPTAKIYDAVEKLTIHLISALRVYDRQKTCKSCAKNLEAFFDDFESAAICLKNYMYEREVLLEKMEKDVEKNDG